MHSFELKILYRTALNRRKDYMYDIIIIGAGTAGISAYKEAIKYTQNILIINKGPWDTTCARVGCMPSKVLISSANRMHDIQYTQEVGLNTQATIDTSQVMQRVRALRDKFSQATLNDVNQWDPSHKISGQAQFINANTVEVNGQLFQAKSFILAVGSTPNTDAALKEELQERLITSDQIFELETLPKSLAVIGSGVIAIELAQAMHRLGVETTIFARSSKVGSLTSPALQTLAQQEIAKELNIKFGILPDHIKRTELGVELTYHKTLLVADYVFSAIGRTSNLHTLQLNQINAEYTDIAHLPINLDTKQLGDYPIFVIGDAFTEAPLQHEAATDGKLSVHNCLSYPNTKNIHSVTPLAIVFCTPEMAIIGQSHRNLSQTKVDFVTGRVSYEKQGRAMVLGKNQGAAEIYVDRVSRKILGAELFVEAAEHLAHLLAWMISEHLTIDEILKKPFYHPTLEEGLRTALKHAHRQLPKLV